MGELFVAYYAVAEASIFLKYQWPRPLRVLDLFAEFRNVRNGVAPPYGYKLNGALAFYGLPKVDKETVELAIRGGPYIAEEKVSFFNYCGRDVDALGALLDPVFQEAGLEDFRRLGQALMRGRYTVAAAQMEANGIPVDVRAFNPTSEFMPKILLRMIEAVDANFGVYEDGTFKSNCFAAYLIRRGIAWPKLASGALALDDTTFNRKVSEHPELKPLKKLRLTLGKVRLHELTDRAGPSESRNAQRFPFADGPELNRAIPNSYLGPPHGFVVLSCRRKGARSSIAISLARRLLSPRRSPVMQIYGPPINRATCTWLSPSRPGWFLWTNGGIAQTSPRSLQDLGAWDRLWHVGGWFGRAFRLASRIGARSHAAPSPHISRFLELVGRRCELRSARLAAGDSLWLADVVAARV